MINQFDELISRRELQKNFFIKKSLLNSYFFNCLSEFISNHVFTFCY